MSVPLRFRFNIDKLADALAYFAADGVTNFSTLKAVGRPIIGDRYVAMDLGPVPEAAYQLADAGRTTGSSADFLYELFFQARQWQVQSYSASTAFAEVRLNIEAPPESTCNHQN